ncbi:MAG: outer membrane beta-barrel protein [Muribaculaceae bacterium]|nr:outer membrane beta-barrel protein [Muribaculaceae bacterium]
MKRILLFLAIVTISLGASALQPQRGYRGFIDWDNNLTQYDVWYQGNHKTYFYTGVSISHGYQFNPNFFLGAGLGVQYNKYSDSYIVPLFIQVRTDQKFGKFTPFGDLRVGFSCTDGGGLYLSPSIGYRFNWGRKVGVNVGVGLTVKGSVVDIFEGKYYDDGIFNITQIGTEYRTKLLFAFRVGFDF